MIDRAATDNQRAEEQVSAERTLERALANGPVLLQHAERFHPRSITEHSLDITPSLHRHLIQLQAEGLGIVGLCWDPEKAVLELFTLNDTEEESEETK